jgi:hypothetical protein
MDYVIIHGKPNPHKGANPRPLPSLFPPPPNSGMVGQIASKEGYGREMMG